MECHYNAETWVKQLSGWSSHPPGSSGSTGLPFFLCMVWQILLALVSANKFTSRAEATGG